MEKKRRNQKYVTEGKFLSYILRHGAEKAGLSIEPSGFVNLNDILNLRDAKRHQLTVEKVKEIVANDEKGRYELVNRPPYFIRAVQGHSLVSVSNEELLTPIQNIFQYPVVVHGTDKKAWESIQKTGLNKMNRNGVHFSIGYAKEGQVKSGMRLNCQVFVEVDAVCAFYNNVPFFKSKNNVILSPGIDGVVDKEYFKIVTDKDGNVLYGCEFAFLIFVKKEEISVIETKENKELFKTNDMTSKCFNDVVKEMISKSAFKSHCIAAVEESYEKEYCELIKKLLLEGSLEYPAAYVDYIIKKENATYIAHFMKKVDFDWKGYYDKLDANS